MTADRKTLQALLERVKEAKGGDRELDLTLARTFVPDVIVLRQRDDDSGADPYTYWEYTGSIDDALALVERVLPGRWSDVLHAAARQFNWHINLSTAEHLRQFPLAILAALLTQLISQTEPVAA